MYDVKLKKPLFCAYNFNREGKKIRAVVDHEVSNGADSYKLWRSAGKPDFQDAAYDDDMYALSVEVNGYLIPLGHTHHSLVKACGSKPALEKMFGSEEKREEFFDNLRKGNSNESRILECVNQERREIQSLGSDPARQAEYIKAFLISRRDNYLKAKESGDCVPPDFVGAVIADDLDGCIKMSEQYRLYQDEKDREKEEKYREEKEAYCLNQNAVAEEKIRGAMASVMAGGRIENEKVTIYKTPDKSKTMTVVSAMMNAAGVDIPIRTKGWIERKLGYIIIRDGECVNLGFLKAKGCKCPERVFDYLNQMAKSIIEKQEGAA